MWEEVAEEPSGRMTVRGFFAGRRCVRQDASLTAMKWPDAPVSAVASCSPVREARSGDRLERESRHRKELQDGQVELFHKYSRDWQSRIDFGYAENESLKVSQERYYRITNLHLRVMFEKDVSPELAMDHMLEMFDNQADRAKIEAYKVARMEAFSRGRQELRNRLSQFPELAEEYDSLLSSDDEEDTLNGDDGNSDASEDIENSPALD